MVTKGNETSFPISGIVVSVKRQAENKIEKERQLRLACEQELAKFRTYCTSLESEIEALYRLLKQHGIQYSEKTNKRPTSSQINVVAEVNCGSFSGEDLNGNEGGGIESLEKEEVERENMEVTNAAY